MIRAHGEIFQMLIYMRGTDSSLKSTDFAFMNGRIDTVSTDPSKIRQDPRVIDQRESVHGTFANSRM